MIAYHQWPKQTFKLFMDQFDAFRRRSEISKDQAFHYLQQNTYPLYRSNLIFREHSPDNYDDWVSALDGLQKRVDKANGYKATGRSSTTNYASGNKNPHHQNYQPSTVPGYGPMAVDAIHHKGKQTVKPKVQGKPPFKRAGPQRLAPHPSGGPLKPSSPSPNCAPQQASSSKPRIFHCYKCNQPGHFTRDFPVNIRAINHHHIQAMEQALEIIYQEQGFTNEETHEELTNENPLSVLVDDGSEGFIEGTDLIDFEGQIEDEDEEEQEQSFV